MDMSMRGRIGAYVAHSRHSGQEMTAAGRRAFLASFERQVDPDGTLDPRERARRAEAALRAHMLRLSAKSVEARRAKANKETKS